MTVPVQNSTAHFLQSMPQCQTNSCNSDFLKTVLWDFLGRTNPISPSTQGCDGIFLWSDVMLHRIGEIKFLGAKVLADKQLHMVGYMIELCYDLALSSDHNISESAGFETPLGFWRSD